MTAADRSRTAVDMTVAGLRDVTGTRLYQRNAFRVTGLSTTADRRTIRQRQRQVLPALEAGADVDLGHSLPVGPEDVRDAFDRLLENPHRRLVDELFWLWGDATAACGCAEALHRDHDAAVLAHSAALDLEVTNGHLPAEADRLWSTAGRMWGKALRRAGFWDHVRARIEALGERQLDESVVDTLRDRVPLTLFQPLVDLMTALPEEQGRLADRARDWPAVPRTVVDDRLEEAAAPYYDAVDAAVTEATEALHANRPEPAAGVVYQQVVPRLRQLAALVPHSRHRRTARVRDTAALILNNCATVLIERDGPGARVNAEKWLGTARELASDPHARQTIDANLGTLDQTVRAFEEIRRRVAELVAAGRPDVARAMLLGIRRQLRGGAGTSQIDRLLATLPTSGYPGKYASVQRDLLREDDERPLRLAHRYTGWDSLFDFVADLWFDHRRKVVTVLVLAALVVAGFLFWPEEQQTGALFSERIADNVPVGTCVAAEDEWNGATSVVPVVPCDQPHWGEVLGYAPLGATPSPYPGPSQTLALASFECGVLVARRGLHFDRFMSTFAYPDEDSWNSGRRRHENYAACVVNRVDDEPLPGGRLVDPEKETEAPSVPMDLFGWTIADNAPVGSCVADKPSDGAPLTDLRVVRCDQPHWAEIVGYPVLYEPGSAWPGDDAVYAAAVAACQQVAGARPPRFRLNVEWPAKDWWQDRKREIYAACTVSRTDDQTFSGGTR